MVDTIPANSIVILKEGDEWVVVIVDKGNVTRRSFEIQQFAKAYALGQAFRLGAPLTE